MGDARAIALNSALAFTEASKINLSNNMLTAKAGERIIKTLFVNPRI